ncbi:MAG: hypothetical protein EBS05_02950 [Proteobacteria bacterium]|nr:hypothetical protein [Pseudomonadota bacterium]
MRISRHYSEALMPGAAAAGSPIRHSPAFTLLEVVLAITIAIAILVVALAFHQQATTLRGALLEESERLAAVRQVMDRLSADLRVAPVHLQFGFTGSSNSLRFISTGLPLPPGIGTDLKRISYQATVSNDGTNISVSGLLRSEEPAVDLITSKIAPALVTATGDTNAPATNGPTAVPLTELIRFLSFRFWDGTAWRDSWSGTTPPPGVEISLGFEPLPADVAPEEYPAEIFRRVIYLPAGQPLAPSTNLVARLHRR